MPKTIGDEIKIYSQKVKVADDEAAAAVAQNAKASSSATDRDNEKPVLVAGLNKTGPVTEPHDDGSYSTYRVVVTGGSPTLLVETSKGLDTPIEDEATPPDDTGNPPAETPPADNPPAVLGDGSGPNPAEPADPGQPSDAAGTLDAPAAEPIVVTDQ